MATTADTETTLQTARRPAWRVRESLSRRLLVFTMIVVLAAEILIFVPNVTAFREAWLAERVDTATSVVLALDGDPDAGPEALARTLLERADVTAVAVTRKGERRAIVGDPANGSAQLVDLRDRPFGRSVSEAFAGFFAPNGQDLKVIYAPKLGDIDLVEATIPVDALVDAQWGYSGRILLSSLLVAGMAGALVYAALIAGVVRPIQRLTQAIEGFRDAPMDASRSMRPSGRLDEIGRAEEALADMEATVRSAMSQRERLASLGAAVSKIAHDLRGSLGVAQLVSERIEGSQDPAVVAAAPRLTRALERAATLAEATLRYGRVEERPPAPETIEVSQAIAEAGEEALVGLAGVRLTIDDAGLAVRADPDHLHRIVTNLIRNAGQALVARARSDGAIIVSTRLDGARVTMDVADNGPGLSEKAKSRLFEPFGGSDRIGGTGLGLAIARELARMNGGDLVLVASGPDGATFRLTLPASV
jgi:signal transduction histidine kinase